MNSLINASRPLVFCPGCSHERVVGALDKALDKLGLAGNQVVIVSDIGCSGLFDTFFNTHAFHGLHGRALTYATGLKMARPDLTVVVTMGDGGLGIGGAHVLSTCRRNIDLTLLVLNNFNYGMTGGQCSSTTPQEAVVGSGFLNRLEKPVDICQVAAAAGAPYVTRTSSYASDLVDNMADAIAFEGFFRDRHVGPVSGALYQAQQADAQDDRRRPGRAAPLPGAGRGQPASGVQPRLPRNHRPDGHTCRPGQGRDPFYTTGQRPPGSSHIRQRGPAHRHVRRNLLPGRHDRRHACHPKK